MKTVVLATNNAHKVSEIATALDFPGWEFRTLAQIGVVSDPLEDADSFEGNALIKAEAVRALCPGLATLSDDSGLVVDALKGAPGVYSARYAGPNATDEDNNNKLLAALSAVPKENRRARFVCTLVFIDEDATQIVCQGEVEGRIGTYARGSEGFGYDPLFFPDAFEGRFTLAEVDEASKNAVSHRGNALRALRHILEAKNVENVLGET